VLLLQLLLQRLQLRLMPLLLLCALQELASGPNSP
jgi:hypothetical protein